ncbi:MAG: hypothetical protein AAB364_00655 [Patescibacteria group bacterium]
MTDLPKVLIIEDDHFYQNKWLRDLAGRANIVRAFDQEEGRKMFAEHPDVKMIVMDGYVPNSSAKTLTDKPGEATTLELVRELRKSFAGVILAVSSSINRDLKSAGCDEVCEDKDEVGAVVLKLLDK